jgi:hypothetical protein
MEVAGKVVTLTHPPHFGLADGGNIFLRNIGIPLQDYTVLQNTNCAQ